ncbi:MAG: sensor histidine kinase [Candidatus Coproplasma sp.]
MEEKKKFFSDPKKFTKLLHCLMLVLLIIFAIVVFVQFMSVNVKPNTAVVITLAGCLVALIILCAIEVYGAITFKGRVAIYVLDFLLLLVINSITGSVFLSALYCIILTQIYLNLNVFHTKIIVFAVSSVGFTSTCVIGWFIRHHWVIAPEQIFELVSDGFVGVIVIAAHFIITNFIIGFYYTNIKLREALKASDERKAELESVYKELSETAVFQERNRIARDIHDNAGHSMTAVIMQTEAAKLLIDTNPEEAKAKIISANIQAKNALEQMRESVHLLAGRSGVQSVGQEIAEVLAQTMDSTDVTVRSDISDVELSWERRHFILNSLKECLANGIRHGGATAFYVEFGQDGENVILTVSDNGCGLPPDFKEGFGLKGIREKATVFGGKLLVESEPDDGCEVKIIIKNNIEDKKESGND